MTTASASPSGHAPDAQVPALGPRIVPHESSRAVTPWWRSRGALQRFVADLLAGELAHLRPGRAVPHLPWSDQTELEADLGADSLERLQLATALAEAIHLHRSEIDDSLLAGHTVGEWVKTAAESLDRFSAELTFRTSGSTGQAKWCVHQLGDLEAETAELAALLAGSRRVFTAVPSHHIYGFLFTILLPARLPAEVIDARTHAPAWLGARLQAGDAVIGYPDFWRAFVRTVPETAAGVAGVTSTAPCPPDLARAVQANGVARFIDVFGSSETAGIGWRDDPRAAYTLFSFWKRGESDRDLIRTQPGGAERRYLAPDSLVWEGARKVRPAGRAEGAVQVGGVNVFPQRVEAVLRSHPGVAQAAVRLMRPAEGARLKAFVVPQPDRDRAALLTELWGWLDARLTAPERPKSIVFGTRLPSGTLGKPADWPLGQTSPGEPDGGDSLYN